MKVALFVVSLRVADSAWTATSSSSPVTGNLLSPIFRVCTLFYGVLGNETFKLAQAYQFMGLFIRMIAGPNSHEDRFGATLQPSRAVRTPGTSRLPAGMVLYELAGMLRRILDHYTVEAAAFGRRAESTKRRDERMIFISSAGLIGACPHSATRGRQGVFFRRPRVQELGRPPTAEEVAEHELETIQRIDSKGCLQRDRCRARSLLELSHTRATDVIDSHYYGSLFNQLPRLTIAPFAGDLRRSNDLWEQYGQMTHCNRSLTTTDNFNYLRFFLRERSLSYCGTFGDI
ncbi:hypothetical protein HPB50_007805 [Hyalomma asiaticum]|uniref:Uncharacterized protein n=1 Tax=Hyalomma asiaticum TaxID=266040 RepID=A0ACB7SWD2_HYAAI|nr:hypothetical protein HPB50_007805 [Hyalomma asiaticum]